MHHGPRFGRRYLGRAHLLPLMMVLMTWIQFHKSEHVSEYRFLVPLVPIIIPHSVSI